MAQRIGNGHVSVGVLRRTHFVPLASCLCLLLGQIGALVLCWLAPTSVALCQAATDLPGVGKDIHRSAVASDALLQEATLYHSGQVFTATSQAVDASWFVVRDGRFVAVGNGDVPAQWETMPRKVDLHGAFVLPGFIDGHLHFGICALPDALH